MCAKIALSRRMEPLQPEADRNSAFQTLHITELVTFRRANLAREYLPRCYSCAPPIRCLIFAGPTRSYAAWRS